MMNGKDGWLTPEELEAESAKWANHFAHHPPAAKQYGEGFQRLADELREWLSTTQEQWDKLAHGFRVPVTLDDAMLLAGFSGLPPSELESMGRKRACEYITGKLLEVKRQRLNREAMLGSANGQPDNEPDSGKKSGEKFPENPNVLRLAAHIRKHAGPGETMTSLARQFAEGDEKKTQSLLRQLRRSPHLLNGT